jgi:hypothetical protein
MEVQPIFETQGVDLQNYYYFENGFNEEELQKVNQLVSRLAFQEGFSKWTLRLASRYWRWPNVKKKSIYYRSIIRP